MTDEREQLAGWLSSRNWDGSTRMDRSTFWLTHADALLASDALAAHTEAAVDAAVLAAVEDARPAERNRVAQLFEDHAATLADFPSDKANLIQLLVMMLRTGTTPNDPTARVVRDGGDS